MTNQRERNAEAIERYAQQVREASADVERAFKKVQELIDRYYPNGIMEKDDAE
ncbi:hypothetical protein [Granulicella mallensis]|uniref:Uncharacterized protein n=1 Tax=Granulicella mallensis (strain ATCC BAA-1857 / DSM 23137 / MP5ACTX8) TaxID=682795 RepID=G8NR84_GRAMM|nr:hypothetical protein [Granulicella mallensis]AEU36162.1 hypothetical protein AciX8_1825 [Granulicella mallensis MP5ACTX8]